MDYVVKCQGCGAFGPFLISVNEDELTESGKLGPIQRYCPACQKTTTWSIAFRDRRISRERRSS